MVSVGSGMERRRAPVVVLIVRVDVRADFDQQCDHLYVTLPHGAVQRRRAVRVPRADERSVTLQELPDPSRVAVFRRADDLTFHRSALPSAVRFTLVVLPVVVN